MTEGRGSGSRLLALVVGIGGLALLLLLGGRVLSASWSGVQSGPPTPTRQLAGLWGTYQQAQTAVTAAGIDLQPISAASHWESPDGETLRSGRGEWTFVFYDSAEKEALDVVVSEGAGRIVDRNRIWEAPEILAEEVVWRGPQEAVAIFLTCGGEEFLAAHSEAIVAAHLGVGDAGRPVWTVSAINVADHDVLSVMMDAETNRVLVTSP